MSFLSVHNGHLLVERASLSLRSAPFQHTRGSCRPTGGLVSPQGGLLAEQSTLSTHRGALAVIRVALSAHRGAFRYTGPLPVHMGIISFHMMTVTPHKFDSPGHKGPLLCHLLNNMTYFMTVTVIKGGVKKVFDKKGSKSLQNHLHRERVANKRPNWIEQSIWDALSIKWGEDGFKCKSDLGEKNRSSDVGGFGQSMHCGGSRSLTSWQRKLQEENPDKEITLYDVFKVHENDLVVEGDHHGVEGDHQGVD
ncbi:hypothetical protein Dimus_011152 [Dionaea muscipula]